MDVWSPDRADHENRSKRSEGRYEGLKDQAPEEIREVKGNLRFPLDFTYHGCPRNSFLSPEFVRNSSHQRWCGCELNILSPEFPYPSSVSSRRNFSS